MQQSYKSSTRVYEESSIKVAIRIRPCNESEINENMVECILPLPDQMGVQELDIETGDIVKNWNNFDSVYGQDSSNASIFEDIGYDLINSALLGFNTVLFMYGQTSSGKTHTLFGSNKERGFIDYAIQYLFDRVSRSEDTEYVIKLSYIELYNEQIKDLLSQSNNDKLKIVDDAFSGPYIAGSCELPIVSVQSLQEALRQGERKRHFGVTQMNARSSRSHVLVRLFIETRATSRKVKQPLRLNWNENEYPSRVSVLNFCDLAGSERASKTGSFKESLVEGGYINKSLLTLGNVIAALSDEKRPSHVPYRDSKLTRLLSTALGGNAKTTIITCVSPASGNILETINSLRFSLRAKRVKNMVSLNDNIGISDIELEFNSLKQEYLIQNREMKRLQRLNESLMKEALNSNQALALIQIFPTLYKSLQSNSNSNKISILSKEIIIDMLIGNKTVDEVTTLLYDLVRRYLPQESNTLNLINTIRIGEMNKHKFNDINSTTLNDNNNSPSSSSPCLGIIANMSNEMIKNISRQISFDEYEKNLTLERLLMNNEDIRAINFKKIDMMNQTSNRLIQEAQSKYTRDITKLQDEVKEVNEMNKKLKSLVYEHEVKESAYSNQLHSQDQLFDESHEIMLQLKASNESKSIEISNLKNDNIQLLALIESKSKEYQEQLEAFQSLSNEYSQLVKSYEQSQQDMLKISNECLVLKDTNNDYYNELMSSNTKISNIEQSLNMKTQESNELNYKLSNLQVELNNQQQQQQQQQQEQEEEQGLVISSMKSKLEIITNQNTNLLKEIQILEDDLLMKSKECQMQEERIQQMELELSEKVINHQILESNLSQLKILYDTSTSTNANESKKILELEIELEQYQYMKRQLDELQILYDTSTNTNEQYQYQLENIIKENQYMKRQLDELKILESNLNNQIDLFQSQLHLKDTNIASLERKQQVLQQEKSIYETYKVNVNNQLDDVSIDLISLEDNILTRQRQLESSQRSYTTMMSQYELEVDVKDKQIQDLLRQLSLLNQSYLDLKNEFDQTKTSLSNEMLNNQLVQDQLTSYQSIQENNIKLTLTYESLQVEYNQLVFDKSKLESSYHLISKQLTSYQQEISMKESLIVSLESELHKKQRDCNNYEVTNSQLHQLHEQYQVDVQLKSKELQDVIVQLQVKEKTIESIQLQVNNITKEKLSLTSQLSQCQLVLIDKSKQLESMSLDITNKEQDIKICNLKIHEVLEQDKVLKQEIVNRNKDMHSLQLQLIDKNDKMNEIKKQASHYEVQALELKGKVYQMEELNEKLQMKLITIQQEFDQISLKVEECDKEGLKNQLIVDELQHKLFVCLEENKTLTSELLSKKDYIQQIESKFTFDTTSYRQKIDKMMLEIQDHTLSNSQLKVLNNQYENQIYDMNQRIQVLEKYANDVESFITRRDLKRIMEHKT